MRYEYIYLCFVGVGFVDAPSVSAEFALCNEDTGMEAGKDSGVWTLVIHAQQDAEPKN
jgi:hypothetical protein